MASTTFSDLIDQNVEVRVHAPRDFKFKKSILSFHTPFQLHEDLAEILKSTSVYKNVFHLNMENDTTEEQASVAFNERVKQLNAVMQAFSSKEFILYVARYLSDASDNVADVIRQEDGSLLPPYMYKSFIADGITSYLSNKGLNSTCNVSRGTLTVFGNIQVNSGITENSELAVGLFNFLGLFSPDRSLRLYEEQYYKNPRGSYKTGSWLNATGDQIFEIGFRIQLLHSTVTFIRKTAKHINIDIDSDATLQALYKGAEDRLEQEIERLESLTLAKAITEDNVLDLNIIKNSPAFQEIELIGLGKEAEKAFYENEAALVILEHIKELIGADSVITFSPYDVEREYAKHSGNPHEAYAEHIALPCGKVRQAMLKFKSELENTTSLVSLFFDKASMRVNVSGDADVDPDTESLYNQREFLDICTGGAYPLVSSEMIVRFVFRK